jgi:hypothetical protein
MTLNSVKQIYFVCVFTHYSSYGAVSVIPAVGIYCLNETFTIDYLCVSFMVDGCFDASFYKMMEGTVKLEVPEGDSNV